MRLHTGLEEVERCGAVRFGSHFLTTSVVHLRHFADERNNVSKELHQTANTHVLACTYAEHGEYRTCHESLADTLAKFVLCQSLFLEELLHKSLIVLGGSLHECLVKLHCLVHLLGWDILDDRSTALGLP